ncbi:MAG: acyl-ACP--UDP-N-acetylglucosamine O-acyltransferase [Candidatus Aminicenantes bacterium]|nr:acyl-ACP--UDP-N-acetylglucosamine O-acyltransferase [Candidatus Aminicenantes bacterium]
MDGLEPSLHPSSVIHPGAGLGPEVRVGPFCVVGPEVSLGPGTVLESHVTISGRVEVGAENRFHPFVAVGGPPQDIGYNGEPTRIKIGDRNIFRESVTVHRPTNKQDLVTIIGDDNYFMAYAHVAHDCVVGNKTIFLHGATLGGHCVVGDSALVGAMSGTHQFCRIGRFSFMGGGSMITQDVLPFCRVVGQRPTRLIGLNLVGLRRNGFSRERIAGIKAVFKILCYRGLSASQAIARIEAEIPPSPDREEILTFVRTAKRGFIKKTLGPWAGESE